MEMMHWYNPVTTARVITVEPVAVCARSEEVAVPWSCPASPTELFEAGIHSSANYQGQEF